MRTAAAGSQLPPFILHALVGGCNREELIEDLSFMAYRDAGDLYCNGKAPVLQVPTEEIEVVLAKDTRVLQGDPHSGL